FGAGEPELLGSPQTEQLVAPRRRLESQLLVVRELLLETFLALVECGHCPPRFSAAAALALIARFARREVSLKLLNRRRRNHRARLCMGGRDGQATRPVPQ